MNPIHLQNLKKYFGFDAFRQGQAEVIAHLDDDRRALAIFPTGGGKSLCYELPAIAYDGLTLVVSPLIALMEQQVGFLNSKGVAAAAMTSGKTADDDRDIRERARRGELKLLYVAPERFNNERFRGLLQQLKIALFAVDEAHCISEWGHNFRPDYLKLAQAAKECRAERILALTATATPKVAEDVCAGFGIPLTAMVRTGFHRPNLAISTTPAKASEREGLLLQRLQTRPRGTTIVYVTRQEAAQRVASQLAKAGLPARHYHAGLEGPERSEVQAWWVAGTDRIVVATIAFGMGIDKADVRYVYHHNLPKSLESYSQEIGRAGRDGAPATVELFASAEDVRALENFAYGDTPSRGAVTRLLAEIFDGDKELQLNPTDISGRLDLRKEVIETALTYLQLDGWLLQKTPIYLGYEFKLLKDREAVLATFDASRRSFLEGVFAQAKQGRIWMSLDPAVAGAALGEDRTRIVKALDYLGEKGAIELRAADARSRYVRLKDPDDRAALAAALAARFERRERNEIGRIQEVLALVVSPDCQANQLAARFGEARAAPCGHCSACLKVARTIAPIADPGPVARALSDAALASAREEAAVLKDERSLARFLCGLSSPGLTKAKLQKHPLFGALEAWPFADVLAHLQAHPG
jgi:ATP-dependent DNA helicase RecQ